MTQMMQDFIVKTKMICPILVKLKKLVVYFDRIQEEEQY